MSTKPTNVTEISPFLRKAETATGFLPEDRFAWFEFIEQNAPEGAPPARVKLCTSLTNAQLAAITGWTPETLTTEVHAADAPYVAEWNIQHRDEDGTVYDVLPPAEIGASAFKYISNSLFWQIHAALANAPFRKLDPKASTPSAATHAL